ncbi:MAG TPA: glycosyltransferase family 39 protein [Thermoleophilaceae bacterium]|nr:glycosyltransferase family 39 protein [Thermoleophilaceae bacterium]
MSTIQQAGRPLVPTRRIPGFAGGVSAAAPRLALGAVVALAALLRFHDLGSMALNPYYDAAVRSMGTSWHAFLVGAFNPNASVAVDKPPLGLWAQVATTKLFGFTSFALLLPEALASTLAVVLLYDLVRRPFGRVAGLGAAAALAVLPVEVMTARSDTMDGVMMALLVLAAWLVYRAVEKGRTRELYAAAAVVGLGFETKLFAALVAVPALAVLFLVGSQVPWPRRLGQLALAGAVMAVVGLAWTAGFALSPSATRPFPLGSSNGSVWNTVFVYNGIGRLTSKSTQTAGDKLTPPGVTRLFDGGPIHLDLLVGMTLFAALAFAVVAALLSLARGRQFARAPLALALAIATWLVLAAAVVSYMKHMPVRYLEVLAPPLAALLGIGIAGAVSAAVRLPGAGVRARTGLRLGAAVAVVGAAGATAVYQDGAAGTLPPAALVAGTAAVVVLVVAWLIMRHGAARGGPATVAASLLLVAVLAAPASQSIALVRSQAADGGALGAMPSSTIRELSSYLTQHRGNARYEFAAATAALAAPLIVADHQPVMILAGTPFHPLVSARGLGRAVRSGQVRYVLISSRLIDHRVHPFPARTEREQIPSWVVAHGTDVTRQTGLHGYGVLYRVSPRAAPPRRA